MSTNEAERCETPKPESHFGCASGCPFIQSLIGAATVILAILGLAGLQNAYILPILVIIVGVALLAEGCALMARCMKKLCEAGKESGQHVHVAGGLNTELLAGAVGVVLGLLALLGVEAQYLVPVAVIVFGTALGWSSCLKAKLCHLESCTSEKSETFMHAAREAAMATLGAQVSIGLAVVILGILGVLGTNMTVLALVAFLILGFSILMCGASRCCYKSQQCS